jgi:hypothetical protein
MACKLRLEFPGGLYYVISRGNYRKVDKGSAQCFMDWLANGILKMSDEAWHVGAG